MTAHDARVPTGTLRLAEHQPERLRARVDVDAHRRVPVAQHRDGRGGGRGGGDVHAPVGHVHGCAPRAGHERDPIDRHARALARRGGEHVGPRVERERSAARGDVETERGPRGTGLARDAHRDRPAVDPDEVGPAPGVDRAAPDRCDRHTRNADLRDRDRLDPGPCGSEEARLFRPHRIDRQPDRASPRRREREADRRGRVRGRPVGDTGNGELPAVAVDVEPYAGRHRMATVGDDGEIEVVEGDGTRRDGLDPLPRDRVERGLPRRRRVAVERGIAAARETAGQERARRDARAGGRPGRLQRALDRGVGRVGTHARVPGDEERARSRERERARDRQLRLGARRHRADRVAGHDENQRVVDRRRAERAQQVGRHLHDLVDPDVPVGVHIAEADFGEPDGIVLPEEVGPVVVGLHDADRERVERAAREGDRLPGGGAGPAVERDVDGPAAVEGQLRVRDVPVRCTRQRLDEVHVIRRDALVEVDLDALAAGVAESLGQPRRRRITVERGRGPILRPVGVRVAVHGRDDSLHADLVGRRERGRLLAGEDVEPGVARIRGERLVGCTGLLGEADRLRDRGPLPRPQPVAVGDDEHVTRAGRAPQRRRRSCTTPSSARRRRRRGDPRPRRPPDLHRRR